MARGGSKKGEHRGAAKRQAKAGMRRKPGPVPGSPSNNPKGREKGTQTKRVRERLDQLGKELGVERLNGLMPKTVMLNIMRVFVNMAMSEMAEAEEARTERQALILRDAPQDSIKIDRLSQRIEFLSALFERHVVLAGDMAYKAASYYHPRLQALVVGNADSDKSPSDMLKALLDEIDGECRQERQAARQQLIEHSAGVTVFDPPARKVEGAS